ncbi:uncharacterized protein LOC100178801 [Ciona intestinalis]
MNMKIVLVLLAVLAAVNASDFGKKPNKKTRFLPEARKMLREASYKAIKFLCDRNVVHPQIFNTICKKVRRRLITGETPVSGYRSEDCIDCEIADPVCWDACPMM